MIDPAVFQQLIAQRQAQMGQQGSSPFQFGRPGGMGAQPGGMQGGGINPYIQMLMQRGGARPMGMAPQGSGYPPAPDWTRMQAMGRGPQGAQGPAPMPQGPQGAPGAPPPQQGPRGQPRQGMGMGGGGDAYQRMFQGPGQGQDQQRQQGMTPTGMPKLQQMNIPTGQGFPSSGRPY